MITAENIEIYFKKSSKPLLKNLNFSLVCTDRCAIIGEEGIGKSTLLKFLHDENSIELYCYYKGKIIRRKAKYGYFEKNLSQEWDECYTSEYFFKKSPTDIVGENALENSLNELLLIFKNLNIRSTLLEYGEKIQYLSKGEKIKLQIAKVMLSKPDILFLDETTNNLDIKTIKWLEEYIGKMGLTSIYVAHDEVLLENTANRILFLRKIDDGPEVQCFVENMNYMEFIINKAKGYGLLHELDAHAKDYLKNTIVIPNDKRIIKYDFFNLSIEKKPLASNINFDVTGPKHVVIVGQSGVGKTVFLEEIYNSLSKRTDLKIGYLSEDYERNINLDAYVYSFLTESRSIEEIERAKPYIKLLNLNEEELKGKLSDLSDGQVIKVIILKFILTKCNVLILDEPTRDLSPLTIRILRQILKYYGGTIISTSHDRKYIEEVCDVVYELKPNGVFLLNKNNLKL